MPQSPNASGPPPLSVFISYSHRDEEFKDELVVHLSTLKRQGKIRAWQDREIEAGAEWDAEIKQQLESADIILLLVTPRFLASDYCYDLEMQRAIERHDDGSTRVIPLIIKPCDWQGTPFSKLQVLPKDAKPITKWDDQDEAFVNIVQGIRRTVESLQAQKHPPTPPTPPSSSPVPPAPSPPPQFSAYNPATFAGRTAETAELADILTGHCRILAITGMTGIGKTILVERVVAHLMDTSASPLPYYRFSLDDRTLTPDFSSSGAALLYTLGDETTLDDQRDPTHLLAHLLDRLISRPCRLQIDSLERLLQGNEQEGWSEFCDPLWLDLLQKFLSGTDCPSQLLLTSQDIPADLDAIASRYPQFWHCQSLQGLNPEEQRLFLQKLGLNPSHSEWDILSRIGEFYDGHPLVLRVIADEIRQSPFRGSISRYWQHYDAEYTSATTTPTTKLARSRLFRRRVQQRVEQSLLRLPAPARQMICACAVFRRPVPVEFWHNMLPEDDPYAAFDTLQEQRLIEYDATSGQNLRVRQHNLIRSIAYGLLRTDLSAWESAERQAAHLWLTAYKPDPDGPLLETVRGYLEAFEHYCDVGDLERAATLPSQMLETGYELQAQLAIWGYFRELIPLQSKQVALAQELGDRQAESHALGNLGSAYERLGQYQQAIDVYQQCLTLAQKIGDRPAQGSALCGLGNAHYSLSEYEQAIDFYQQHLTMAQELDNRREEGNALGNLGSAYFSLGQYDQAIDFHQQHLAIAQDIGDRQSEGIARVNLGVNQMKVERYSAARDNLHTALEIFRAIGSRYGEAADLKYLAELHQALGEIEPARQYCQQALDLATDLGIPIKAECEQLQAQLADA